MSNMFDRLGARSFLHDLNAAKTVIGGFKATNAVPEVIINLVQQIDDLIYIASSFDDVATAERRNPSAHATPPSVGELLHLQSVLQSTAAVIRECTTFIQVLRSTVEAVTRDSDEGVATTNEPQLENQVWYEEVYQGLRLRAEVLGALSTAIDLLYDTDKTVQPLETRPLASRLHNQVMLVEQTLRSTSCRGVDDVQTAVQVARDVTVYSPFFSNKHFFIRSTPSYFTGRERQLAMLDAAFRYPAQPFQLRFVIYGLSGSGKTELAFKFAEEYRHRFWGVFFVDGSSRKNASSSYAGIAMEGGVEPKEKAAKNWLATRDLPWLLIVDNVDKEEINVDELLPPGTKGCVLITTRNPALMTYGNAGDRHMELMPMEPRDAETLIMKAAEEPRPGPKLVVDSASSICHALGFLPLALVQAAHAILRGICSWPEYLTFYDRQIQRIRRTLHGRSRSRSEGRKRTDDDNSNLNVLSTYEILYESLESSPKEHYQDAIELLHVFSFFHFQNIRLDILIGAATNPVKEEEKGREDESQQRELLKKLAKPPHKPWIMRLRELRAHVNSSMLATPTPLPAVLRNRSNVCPKDFESDVDLRLRDALTVLTARSLVIEHEKGTGRYSMHRLVHKWIRERPEMSIAHQALWCEISMTTLAMSIPLPPFDDDNNKKESHARRELLPHIRHVTTHHAFLKKRLEDNSVTRRSIWPIGNSYGKLQAEQDVRFSRVYEETGNFREAYELQDRALGYVSGRLGPDHPFAIHLSLFLCKTLWELSEMDRAVQKQRQVRQLCVATWGEDHPLTLDVTDWLGLTLYYKGRWSEAISLHAKNTEKLKMLYGEKHSKTLQSIRNLAQVHYRYMDYDKATELHQIAWDGMKETLGETNLQTLTSLADLSMSYVRYGASSEDHLRNERLAQSHKNLTIVYEQRVEQLGKEHPFTLLAALYLARVKSEQGQHLEAERMIKDGLDIAERNMGEAHIGVLLAKTIYAQVLARLGDFAQAEQIFSALIDKQRYTRMADEDGDHPDRLTNIFFLTQCLEDQGKLKEALERCEEFLAGIATIGGQGRGLTHKILPRMRETAARLQEKLQKTSSEGEGEDGSVGKV
ncbi:hypothetical protein F4803DRAFT_561327 [Xylaria telfairii]|nr:hypothetical protein F4803DRAFT_561327 [Xylaria telfairii]